MTYADLTIVIPVRIDSAERLRNLNFVLNRLRELEGLKIIVLEADIVPKTDNYEGVRKVFVEDCNPLFHRTKYINILNSLADTKLLGVWDSDVIVPLEQFDDALELLRSNSADMVYPYDGRFYNVYGSLLEEFLQSRDEKILTQNRDNHHLVFGHHSCGGAFVVRREAYTQAGGENERFIAWAPEDLERYKRWEILGYRVLRTQGAIYHLWHPIGENSRYFNSQIKIDALKTLLEICRGK
ncbi:hypothetical protein BN938_0493 [Mucinivorans hirudinis]|uniref:Galactosyltransferase C-terminal domain-containing protein n=1 Tax=Mucinivorans hirudinis TaxID=1433126 RepID=A0A060R9W6_9BACT|nr:hypothetical protein BN938_0493 [Mucinivorans hirudinis]